MWQLTTIMEDSKTLFLSSIFPWAHERLFSKYVYTSWALVLKPFAAPDTGRRV